MYKPARVEKRLSSIVMAKLRDMVNPSQTIAKYNNLRLYPFYSFSLGKTIAGTERYHVHKKPDEPVQQLTYNSYIDLIYGGRHHLDTCQETNKKS